MSRDRVLLVRELENPSNFRVASSGIRRMVKFPETTDRWALHGCDVFLSGFLMRCLND